MSLKVHFLFSFPGKLNYRALKLETLENIYSRCFNICILVLCNAVFMGNLKMHKGRQCQDPS